MFVRSVTTLTVVRARRDDDDDDDVIDDDDADGRRWRTRNAREEETGGPTRASGARSTNGDEGKR